MIGTILDLVDDAKMAAELMKKRKVRKIKDGKVVEEYENVKVAAAMNNMDPKILRKIIRKGLEHDGHRFVFVPKNA